MTKVYGNHAQLNITAGDTVQVRGGGVGKVVKVHKKFDGFTFGNIANYQIDTGSGLVWMEDYLVEAVEYA